MSPQDTKEDLLHEPRGKLHRFVGGVFLFIKRWKLGEGGRGKKKRLDIPGGWETYAFKFPRDAQGSH